MARRPKDRPATILRVVRGGYEPASAYDAEIHAGMRLGAEVTAEIVQPKDGQLLRKYWWTLALVVQNQDRYPESEDLHAAILMALGYTREATALIGGDVHIVPRGISDMDGQEFSRFVDRAFAFMEDVFGIDVEALQNDARRATETRSNF
jgi:hypothetical protein